MPDNQKPSNDIHSGAVIEPPAPGKVFPWLAERTGLAALVAAAVSWLNLSVIVTLKKSDGTVQALAPVKPVITGRNSTLTLPIDLTALSSSSGNRYFKGAGAPSAATLSADFTYISTSSMVAPAGPDHYYDITDPADPDLWVCITAGTNETSAWFNLSGCP